MLHLLMSIICLEWDGSVFELLKCLEKFIFHKSIRSACAHDRGIHGIHDVHILDNLKF